MARTKKWAQKMGNPKKAQNGVVKPHPSQPSSNWAKLMPSVVGKADKKQRRIDKKAKQAKRLEERLAKQRPAAAPSAASSSAVGLPALTPEKLCAPVAMPPLEPLRAAERELTGRLALDCEMVGVGPRGCRNALAQVAIVNEHEVPVYVCYVRPSEHVTDFRTRFSGVRPHHMKHALPFERVQQEARIAVPAAPAAFAAIATRVVVRAAGCGAAGRAHRGGPCAAQ
jgi:hypothetical protein